MFSKLRNKLLIWIMLAIMAVMLGSFVAIYWITNGNIRYVNHSKLEDVAERGVILTSYEMPSNYGLGGASTVVEPNAAYSFTLTTDRNGKIIEINSRSNLSQSDYETAAKTAVEGTGNSMVHLGNEQWQYLVKQKDGNLVLAYLNVTESNRTLGNLSNTLIKISVFALLIIFGLSYYFANRAIKPLIIAWDKQAQFIADASHELKTPITIITANYDTLMLKKDQTIESQLKWFDYIKVGTDRMTKLTNDLLSLAKLEGSSELQKSLFYISDSVKETISPFENTISKKRIQLNLQIDPQMRINSDLDKIKQVLTILFDNAVKYTDEEGRIHLVVTKTKRLVVFSLENTSQGIPKTNLSKVFDRFYRGDPSRSKKTDGHGLGLPIAKSIVISLGGNIRAHTTERNGIVFAFTIPSV